MKILSTPSSPLVVDPYSLVAPQISNAGAKSPGVHSKNATAVWALIPTEAAEGQKRNRKMAAQCGDPNFGGRNEYPSLETDYLQARNAFLMPEVPVVLISAQRPGNDIPGSPNDRGHDVHERFVEQVAGAEHLRDDP